MPEPNGWNEWSRHVLHELERLNDNYTALDRRLAKLQQDFVALKTEFQIKSGLWGLLGGAIVAGIALLTKLVR